MANLTSVQINSGVPDSGTGTVSTIDALMADGGQATLGAQADVAYTSGSGSLVAILKGIFGKLSNSLSVTGTFWQATQPVSAASLPLPTGAAKETGGNLATIATNIPPQGQALAAASVPVVLTAAQQTALTPPAAITGFALASHQTDATQKTQIVDASGNVIGSTSNALNVNITAGGGSGGTSSLFGAAFPSTGTAIGLTNGTNMVAWSATANYGTSPGAIPVPAVNAYVTGGAITANAGTNLNTSALALESGGNLATVATNTTAESTTVGGVSDAAVTAGATGSLSAKLRSISRDIVANIVLAAGSAIIGKVGIDQTTPGTTNGVQVNNFNSNGAAVSASSAPAVIASDQATLAFAYDTSQIMNGKAGVSLTPAKVKISIASATTTTLVALVSSKRIRVLSMYLISTAGNTINLQSHTTTTNSDGLPGYAANGGLVLPFNPLGWFDTTSGEALDMVTSGSGQVSGQLVYVAC